MKDDFKSGEVRVEDIKFFSVVSPGKEVFLIDLTNTWQKDKSLNLKSPKTGKTSKVVNNGRCKIAVFGVDAVWKNKLNTAMDNLTKNTGGVIRYPDQMEKIVSYLENNCKGINIRSLKDDEKIALTDKEKDINLLVEDKKTKERKAAFIMPFSVVRMGTTDYRKVGEDGAYFIKSDENGDAELLKPEEFDKKFVSKDTRYTRRRLVRDVFNWDDVKQKNAGYVAPNVNTAKVSTHSSFDASYELAKKYMEKHKDAIKAHAEGLVISSNEAVKDKGFMAFVEDMGALPEKLRGKNTTFTISKNMMHLRGRLSVGEFMMEKAKEAGNVTGEKIANFNDQTYFDERQGSQSHGGNAPISHLPYRYDENKSLPKEIKYEQMSIFDMVGKNNNAR